MTQILPIISFWENLQLNAVLENRNLSRLYCRSLVRCQASHLKSTFQAIIRPWVPELGQNTEKSDKICNLSTKAKLYWEINMWSFLNCPYFLPKICFSRTIWKMKLMPLCTASMNHTNTIVTNTPKSQRRKKINAFIFWVGLDQYAI